MDPWTADEQPPAPRRPGWGCLAALLVTVVGLVIVAILAAGLLTTALDGVRIR